jgi:hypothetical protein
VRVCFQQSISLRDCNNVIALTHIELLVGCAVPVWIWSYLNFSGDFSREFSTLRLLPHLGWITVGIGDSVVSRALIHFAQCSQAAIVGKFLGRHRWIPENSSLKLYFGSSVARRTVEGSVGCYLAMILTSYGRIFSSSFFTFGSDFALYLARTDSIPNLVGNTGRSFGDCLMTIP